MILHALFMLVFFFVINVSNAQTGIKNLQVEYTQTNITATLFLPATNIGNITEGGKSIACRKGIRFTRFQNGKAVLEL